MKRASQPKTNSHQPPDVRPPLDSGPAHLGFQINRTLLVAALCGLTLVLMSQIHAPTDRWYLAYGCMVPWLIVIGGTSSAPRVYVTSWVLGLVYFLYNMSWMEAPTGEGYFALSGYLACYFPLAACPIRHAVRRRRFPLSVAFPVIWVGAEFLRGIVLSGFPWFFLAHSQYQRLSMIQISDLVGAYGVTFVIAAVNGAIADVLFSRLGEMHPDMKARQVRRGNASVVFAVVLVGLTLGYGAYQLSRDTVTQGPKIALLQQDFPNYTDRDRIRAEPGPPEKMQAYFAMLAQAESEAPDLYMFPETAWAWMHLNREFLEADPEDIKNAYFRQLQDWSRFCFEKLQDWSARTRASILIGSLSVTPTPDSLWSTELLHNSAFHIQPDRSPAKRHDKIHPVLFGEIVPFRFGRLRFLYLWLNSLSPFGSGGYEYSLTPGTDTEVFEMTGRDGRRHRFGVLICYEDVMPYVCRRSVWDKKLRVKRVDFLLNISNDGWFEHGSELQQHFAICTFRAVENRVGVARTVNTGVSGFIDPNGRAYENIGVGVVDHRVARVAKDSRTSLYCRIGDVFAVLCTLFGTLMYVDYVFVRTKYGRRKGVRAEA